MHAGDSQDITLSVGKQPTTASQKLDFPAPVISKVTGSISGKDTVPSWGDTITIEGKYLGSQSIGATVQLVLADQSTLPSCQVNSWTQLKINCTTAGFPDILKTTEVVNVVVTTASGSSNKEALSYEACDFLTKAGGLCKQDGSQECNTNYECSYSGSTKMIPNNGVCDHEGATCHCPESAAECKNGVFHAETCSCECTNGWSSSGAAQIPDAFVNGQAGIYGTSAGVCDTCSQSCGSLDKKVETPDKCGCEFNKLNLIWILLLVVLFLVAVGFGVWKYKKSQPDHIPLNKPLIKDEAQDDEEDPERTDSAAYM